MDTPPTEGADDLVKNGPTDKESYLVERKGWGRAKVNPVGR